MAVSVRPSLAASARSPQRYKAFQPTRALPYSLTPHVRRVFGVFFHAVGECVCHLAKPRGLLYTAASGEGTFVRALSAGADDSRRVFVDHARKPCDTRVLESVEAGHTSHAVAAQVCSDLGITLPPIRVDGQCKYGLLSEGQVRRP